MARNRKRAKERRARRPQSVAATARVDAEAAPDPLEHATPDAELAEAQLAVGRPELAQEPAAGGDGLGVEDDEPFEDDDDAVTAPGAVAVPGGAAPDQHAHAGNRLINFIQGSWRELQRVQWPDRRQVMQATGVVIGFVIIAGVFLGVADFLAGKVMNYVLTGHFK